MTASVKTDNAHFQQKADMRQAFLEALNLPAVNVLDLCAGASKLWTHLSDKLNVERYLPCDRAPRSPLVIKGEAYQLVQSIDLAPFNVIDIDTYGEPWEVTEQLLPRLTREVVIFLTHGHLGKSFTASHAAKRAAGLPTAWDVPASQPLAVYLSGHAIRTFWNYGTVLKATRIHQPRVTYWAIHFRPNKSSQPLEGRTLGVIESAVNRAPLKRRPIRQSPQEGRAPMADSVTTLPEVAHV